MGAGNQLLPGVFFGDIAKMGVFVSDTCDGCRNQLLDVFFSDIVMVGAGITPPPPPPPGGAFVSDTVVMGAGINCSQVYSSATLR